MVNPKEISVVIQGAVDFSIIDPVLQSVRNVLPKAEVVLSTWEGVDYTPINPLYYDKLVLSPDPGGFPLVADGSVLNNVDRQVRSTAAGIAQVTRPYCLKIRTDMVLTHTDFLSYFEKYTVYQEEYRLVKSRMLNNASGTGDPFWNLPLHPADFFLFGYTEDVKAFFSALPYPEADKQYQHIYLAILTQLFPPVLNKQLPETYLFTSFLNLKKFQFDEIAQYELSANSVATSYALLVNNFVFLSSKQLGYQQLKNPDHEHANYFRSFTNLKWQRIYQVFCNPSHRLIDEEPPEALVPFCGVLYKALINNSLNWQLPWLIKLVLLLLRAKARRHEKRCLRKKMIFPQGSQLRDIIRVELLQKMVCLMSADKPLLKALAPYMNLYKQR
jgi:hypothetical protein